MSSEFKHIKQEFVTPEQSSIPFGFVLFERGIINVRKIHAISCNNYEHAGEFLPEYNSSVWDVTVMLTGRDYNLFESFKCKADAEKKFYEILMVLSRIAAIEGNDEIEREFLSLS